MAHPLLRILLLALSLLSALESSASTSLPIELLAQGATVVQNQPTPRQTRFRIPFEYINGFIVVPVQIGSYFEAQFLFDTGSAHTVITDRQLVPYLGRELEEEVKIIGSDLSTILSGNIVRRVELGVGSLDIRAQSVIVLDDGLINLPSVTGRPVTGILGIRAFGAYAITIDYQAEVIILGPTPSAKLTRKLQAHTIQVERHKAYLTLPAQIHPDYSDSLRLLLDTGASLELMLHATASDSTIYPNRLVPGQIGIGLGGSLYGYIGRSDWLDMSQQALTDVITYFQTVSTTALQDTLPYRNGLIGNGILDRYRLILDLPNEMLYLKETRSIKRKSVFDRSGLRLVATGSNLQAYLVQRIGPGSPAERAGLRIGDQITHLNGIPRAFLTLDGIRRRLRKAPGKRVHLRVNRSGYRLNFSFTLEELI